MPDLTALHTYPTLEINNNNRFMGKFFFISLLNVLLDRYIAYIKTCIAPENGYP